MSNRIPGQAQRTMTDEALVADPAQRDLAWAGYHPRALAPAMLVTMIVHFLLYPAAWERLFVGFYVVTVLLVARWAATVSGRAP